jgi:hypothetical protein
MAKEAITRHEQLKTERDDLKSGDYEAMIEELVDETITNIKSRLIGE